MSIKADNVIRHIEKNGHATLKLDRASGFTLLTISKRGNDYVVGYQPGSMIKRINRADLRAMLVENAIYVESWR